ncbi:sugar transporter ERD6-like 6 [Lathyrus oleraceus]|uniref:sugar transporter ERD6-like 6 n=1 Tax=Pisum sativum TaxID=3888 RepID=UPI0021D133EA|nr:sugar transporter ERD6-like 6 [Pisum sativum]
MALSLLVVSISFYLKEYISPDSDLYATLSLVSVAGVVVMVIAFSLGLGAMPWIIMSEILPINIKGLAGSFATLANWFFSWLVTLTANLLLDWSSGGSMWFEDEQHMYVKFKFRPCDTSINEDRGKVIPTGILPPETVWIKTLTSSQNILANPDNLMDDIAPR